MEPQQARAVKSVTLEIMHALCIEPELPTGLWDKTHPLFNRLLRISAGKEEPTGEIERQWSKERVSLLERNTELAAALRARGEEVAHLRRALASAKENPMSESRTSLEEAQALAAKIQAKHPTRSFQHGLSRVIDQVGRKATAEEIGIPLEALDHLLANPSEWSSSLVEKVTDFELRLEKEGRLP